MKESILQVHRPVEPSTEPGQKLEILASGCNINLVLAWLAPTKRYIIHTNETTITPVVVLLDLLVFEGWKSVTTAELPE